MNKLLLIDNYDSFTYNLSHYLSQLNIHLEVKRNDDQFLEDAAEESDYIVISPGPSIPQNAGKSFPIVEKYYKSKKILGVCLGMQIINEFFGGNTVMAPYPVHGKTCYITHDGQNLLFKNLPESFEVARYHSLICSGIQQPLKITAAFEYIPMAIEHETLPIFGVQFHPESFMSNYGLELLQNFLLCT